METTVILNTRKILVTSHWYWNGSQKQAVKLEIVYKADECDGGNDYQRLETSDVTDYDRWLPEVVQYFKYITE